VSLLLSLVLLDAISPAEAPPADEAPLAETSPTSADDAAAAPTDATEAPGATDAPEARPDEPAVAPEARPDETPVAETPVEPPRPAQTSEAPGGYWTLAEQHERSRRPPDGEDELTIGSVLFSLGFLRAGAGVLTALMANDPELCPLTEARSCSGLRNYGWAGVAEGGLMIGTGITYLAIGASRRQRHRRWERGETLSLWRSGTALDLVDVAPWLISRDRSGVSPARIGGAGLRLQLRF
jgi:hypothetical protein